MPSRFLPLWNVMYFEERKRDGSQNRYLVYVDGLTDCIGNFTL